MMQHNAALHRFLPGMYVRVPLDTDQNREDFREFRIGQIRSIDLTAATATVHFIHPDQNGATDSECTIDYLERCHILPDTLFTTIHGSKEGRILLHCSDDRGENEFQQYYVIFFGENKTQSLSEQEIVVSSIRQNPLPEDQLRRYEFHNPMWKSLRDQVIESYHTLRNATFGIEDLVGSRIMLLSHQAEVVSRVLGDPECRYILADEVGLGKTIEASVILKGLQRRNPGLKTLVVAPGSLTRQWQNELDSKFWLHFPLLRTGLRSVSGMQDLNGAIVNIEDLTANPSLWQFINRIEWGLLIVDEAHNIRKTPQTYTLIRHLSQKAQRVLILSATPIQRYANEYLKLLALMNPKKYDPEDKEIFATMLKAQGKIRSKVVALAQNLNPKEFDPEEFEEGIERLVRDLKDDMVLRTLVKNFSRSPKQTLEDAMGILAYISENYRIENRVIRNRRAHLAISLPERQLNTNFSYIPSEEEEATLDALYEYIERYIQSFNIDELKDDQYALIAEYCRTFLHASASSPHALLAIVEQRLNCIQHQSQIPLPDNVPASLLSFTAPRLEAGRINLLMSAAPTLSSERHKYIEELHWRTQTWLEKTEQELTRLSQQRGPLKTNGTHRLAQVLLALEAVATSKTKAVAFSTWPQTLEALAPHIQQRFGRAILSQFNASMNAEDLQEEVNLFQESERCRILLCDELGGEGRNFQIASQIIHIDLPWTPAQLEQRIGRVDRLGKEGTVLSIVPFAQNGLEQDLFRIWQDAFHLFTQSMSGLEIKLEGIQNELLTAMVTNPRTGLAEIVPDMVEQAAKLQKSVDEERYYEEIAVNRQQRYEFERISEDYRDGRKLRIPILKWADLCGLDNDYDPIFDTVTYNPRRFNHIQRQNAKLFDFPNMEEALLRSGRQRDLVLRGSFNRSVAVQREKLVFFAPSSDKWTDAIIANAMESDRGRCCAIQRQLSEFSGTWEGIEILYSLSIDPRPLYAGGFDPTHLFQALGFLRSTLHRVAISLDGEVLSKSSPIWKTITKTPYSGSRGDLHLGRRDESHRGSAQMHMFKQRYPSEEWNAMLDNIFAIAQQNIEGELSFMEEEAEFAKIEFEKKIAGLRAADLWLQRTLGDVNLQQTSTAKEYEQVVQALVKGISHPLCQMESVCFWRIEGRN